MKAASEFSERRFGGGFVGGAWLCRRAVAVQFASVSVAQAAVVSRIDVRAISASTPRRFATTSPSRPGSPSRSADIDEAVKRLFGTGLFSDVRINQVGSTLVVQVAEYPGRQPGAVPGQQEDQGRAARRRGAVEAARHVLAADSWRPTPRRSAQAYSRIGRDDATVTTQIIDLGENRVNVVFEINEGGRTKIAAINFVGNNAFSDRRLSDVISTKRSTILSFVLRDDIYDEDRLRADEEALRRFYYNRGYADFQVVSASGELDEATNEYTVTITVEEGERYTFGDISVDSTIAGRRPANRCMPLVETQPGDVYSAKDVEDTIIALTEHVAGHGLCLRAGHAARRPQLREPHDLGRLYDRPGRRAPMSSASKSAATTRTRDYVIRREFDVSEGDAFNQVLIQRAKRRLEALDYL